MRVRLHTLGCRLNEAETETWAAQFRRRGFAIAGRDELAELVVVNTCAVTGEAVRKSRNLLRRARRHHPGAKLIVSGCYASLEAETIAAATGVDLLVTNRDKDHLVGIAIERLRLEARAAQVSDQDAAPLFGRGRQRAFVKVQDGCRHRCTFCIVSRARGPERSRPLAEVVDEVDRLSGGGVQEVVLTGVHLGGYGRDLGLDLAGLLRALLDRTRMERIRLGALEPWDLPNGLWELLREPRLMPHLHLPLQSGSDAVLRRMGRRASSAHFARLAAKGRDAVPDLNLGTDIIVGFPGETEHDWAETLAFVEAMAFGQVHVFSYSPRPGTPAAGLPDQVPAPVKRERVRQLGELAGRLRRRTLERFIGRRMPVLVEGADPVAGQAERFGYTSNYLPVCVTEAPDWVGRQRIVDVSLTGIRHHGEALTGRP